MEIPRVVVLPILVAICCVALAIWLLLFRPQLAMESLEKPELIEEVRLVPPQSPDQQTGGGSTTNLRRPPLESTSRPGSRSPKIRTHSQTPGTNPGTNRGNRYAVSNAVQRESLLDEQQKISEPRDGLGPSTNAEIYDEYNSDVESNSGVDDDGVNNKDTTRSGSLSSTPLPAQPSAARGSGVDESPWVKLHKDDMLEQRALVHSAAARPPRAPLCTPHPLTYTTRLRRCTFESEARDTQLYPSPSYYRMNLSVIQKNVIGMGLNLAVIPVSEYNINIYTQWLDIEVAGVLYSIQLPEGNYTNVTPGITNFSTALTVALIATSPVFAAYTVAFEALTNKYIIKTHGGPCILRFGTGPNVNRSLWQVMGYPRVDTLDLTVQESPGVVNMFGALAIDLFIEEISNAIDSADNMFARLDLNRIATSEYCFITPPGDGLPRYFWPISRLTFLTFSFKVRYSEVLPDNTIIQRYRPYLFNNALSWLLNIIKKNSTFSF